MSQSTQEEPQLIGESSVDYRDPEKGDAVRNMFAGIAHCYDRMNRVLSFNRDQAWRKRAVAMSGLTKDSRVLDVCCGTGDLSIAYAKRLMSLGADKIDVTGTDFTPEMVAIAEQKNQRYGTSIPYLVADTMKLPFENNDFDVCSVAFGIRNVQDVGAGIAEMTRVVKPGGRVVILEFTQPKGKLLQPFVRWYMTRVLPRIGHLFSRSKDKAYSYLPDSIALFPPPQELKAMMEKCGLENVHYKLMNVGLVSVHVGTKKA